jgi:hypothetical protein
MNFEKGMRWFALLAVSSVSSAFGQCAITPIKPIPPLGCKDVTPQCVADGKGHATWTWACVKDSDETKTSNFPTWKPTPRIQPRPELQSPPVLSQHSEVPVTAAPTPDLSWVKIGMSRQEVIGSLTGHFKVTREDRGDETGSQIDVWSVESLSQPALGFCEIAFVDGKVGSIITNSAPLRQSDVLMLAQRLFADLYPRGDLNNSKAGKFLGERNLTVQIKMFQMTSERGNEETVRFQFDNGRSFEIKINVPVKGSPDVRTSEFQTQ